MDQPAVLRLTVLGSCGTYPAPRRACSGYLLEAAGEHGRPVRVWVDAGSGTLANLLRVTTLQELDAIWVSHLHIDHCSDLPVAWYALKYGGAEPPAAPVRVLGPSGWARHVADFLSTDLPGAFEEVFAPHELHDGDLVELGRLRLTAVATRHSIETYGLRAEVPGATVGYSADSGPCDGLERIADGADLFLCEAAWLEQPPGALPIHMTPALAGRAAAGAGAGRLVLTHLRPRGGRPDRDGMFADRAREAYRGDVAVALEGDVYELGGAT
jgi:ribonuclease BN (tRNA processing enzyme)